MSNERLRVSFYNSSIISTVILFFICEAFEVNSNTKTILLWSSYLENMDRDTGNGSEPFYSLDCEVKNCFVTSNRGWIPIEKFDAIVFHGIQYFSIYGNNNPSPRSAEQYYVYYNNEPPALWSTMWSANRFMNLTATHRLKSDIIVSYFRLVDHSGNVVAPSLVPNWTEPVITDYTEEVYIRNIYTKKSRPVAWYVSHCVTSSQREKYVNVLRNHIPVDIYGKCSSNKCLKPHTSECDDLIKRKYFFYLAFENSICVDYEYVSEKVLKGLNNDAVPVLYGGADLNSFLPPKSYIDATKFNPRQLAKYLSWLIKNPAEYVSYFWWKVFYRVRKPLPFFCSLCKLLHERSKEPKLYDDLHTWLNGNVSFPACKSGQELMQSLVPSAVMNKGKYIEE